MVAPGIAFLRAVAAPVWELLEHMEQAARGHPGLQLPPAPGWPAPLAGRLLAPIGDLSFGEPVLDETLALLRRLLPGTPLAALHGWAPGPGPERSLAAVAGDPTGAVVISLHRDPGDGFGLRIHAVAQEAPLTLPLADGWSLELISSGPGTVAFFAGLDGRSRRLEGSAPADLHLTLLHDGARPLTLGLGDGPHATVRALEASLGLSGTAPVSARGRLSLTGAELTVLPPSLGALVGLERLGFDVPLTLDPQGGLGFAGGRALSVPVPVNSGVPFVDLLGLVVELAAGNGIELRVRAGLRVGGPAVPLQSLVDGAGTSLRLHADATRGVGVGPVELVPPVGLGVTLSLPGVRGGGVVAQVGPDSYGGALELRVGPIVVQAFGLFELPAGGRPLSFVALLSLRLPLPGIQVGFGFAVSAVGGVVGVNRRVDSSVLEARVADGSAARLLFPENAAADAPAIVRTLGTVFPSQLGQLLVGPMVEMSWGGRIVRIAVVVIVQAPDPVRLLVLGRLTVALPDPLVPLVLVQATVAGTIDPAIPSVRIMASLTGSHLVGIPLGGELFMLVRGGRDPHFIISAGGFHPRYRRPPDVPSLRRLSIQLGPLLRSESYLAVTSNTVQFGARLELDATIADCGLRGHFGFDVLFAWAPRFSFVASVSAGIEVRVLGEKLAGINLDLLLEGPSPWHAVGTGHVELLCFDASFDFDVTWGRPAPALVPPDVEPALRDALDDPTAWRAEAPLRDGGPVVLSDAAAHDLTAGTVLHPLGELAVRQGVVPLGLTLQRFANLPVPPQRWTLVGAELRQGVSVDTAEPLPDLFPAGQFLDLTDEDRLTRPAFQPYVAGARLTPRGVRVAPEHPVDTGYETKLVGGPPPVTTPLDTGLIMFEILIRYERRPLHRWLQPAVPRMVAVAAAQPVVVATTDTLRPAGLMTLLKEGEPVGQTLADLAETLAGDPSLQLVEHWEVAR